MLTNLSKQKERLRIVESVPNSFREALSTRPTNIFKQNVNVEADFCRIMLQAKWPNPRF